MMIETNALLIIGFSLIAGFSNVVHIPDGAVPTKVEDLQKCVVGSPHSPVDLYLVDKLGREFWIRDGVVARFCCPGCYKDWRAGHEVPKLERVPMLSSNDVLAACRT
jgi:hypothetical protein